MKAWSSIPLKPLIFVALAGLMTFGTGHTAEAALRLQITVQRGDILLSEDVNWGDDGTLQITGGTATLVKDPMTGFTSIRYIGTLNDVNFNLGIAGENYIPGAAGETNEPGSPSFGFVNVSGKFGRADTGNNGSRDVTITAWADDFRMPITPDSITQKLTVSGNVEGGGNLNNVVATGSVIDESTPTTNSSTVQSQKIDFIKNPGTMDIVVEKSIPNLTAPYTVTTSFTGTLNNGGQVTDFSINHTLSKPVAVPEPANIAMAGVGVALSLAGLALRRRGR